MEASFVNPGHKLFLRNGLSISNWRTTDLLIDLGSKESRFDELLFAPGLADLYTLVLLGRKDTGSRRSVGWYSEEIGLKDSIFFIRQKPVSVKKTKEGLVSGQGAHGILSSAFHQKKRAHRELLYDVPKGLVSLTLLRFLHQGKESSAP